MRMSYFIVGLILVSLIITTLSLTMSDLADTYVVTSYNESDMEVYNQLGEMQNLTHQIQDKVDETKTSTGITDLVGGFISSAIDGLKLAKTSFNTFDVMSKEAIKQSTLPDYFRVALFSIVLILIFIGIIMAAMIKWNL